MSFSDRIYRQAVRGTDVNPSGLPPALADLVVLQAQHETGNFKSNIFREGNNAFGYTYVPGARYQSGPGRVADNGQPAATYASVEDSTREIVDWIYRRRKEGKFPFDLSTVTDPAQYAALLKQSGYYGDTLANYTRGLVEWAKSYSRPAGGGLGVVLLVAAAWWLFRGSGQ